MELIEYGPARFNIIRTIRCERSRITDSANNYLHTHWDILVQVNYQPVMGSAYDLPGGIFTAPVATPGTFPGRTDTSLLVPLLQPRQLLRITAGGAVILETPSQIEPGGQRYACDVKGGPSVEVVGVPQMIGTKHWVVVLHIIADARDRRQTFPQGKSAVISNLWVSTEDIDFQRRSVRRFAGRAILRADVMRLATSNANTYRDLYLFKCPKHYKRQNVQVRLSEDGTVCDWSFDDVMQGYDLGVGSPIVKIDCFKSGMMTRRSPLKFLMDAMRGLRQGGITGAPFALFAAGLENLPISYRHVRCDLIGDRNADLGNLSSIAYSVCSFHLGLRSFGAFVTGTQEVIFRQDLADQVYTSCEISSSFTDEAIVNAAAQAGFGIIQALPQIARGNLGGLANWRDFVPQVIRDNATAATQQLIADFFLDHRNVQMEHAANEQPAAAAPIPNLEQPPANVVISTVASREGTQTGPANARWGEANTNPPLLQGAFGVVPQDVPGRGNIPPQINAASADPQGRVPDGVERLIAQAILGTNFALGQNQEPPEPPTLQTES